MAVSTDVLERELLNDLKTLHNMVQTDDSFDEELYRALAGVQWHRTGSGGGHVTLSWKRAEKVINEQRAVHDRDPLTLAQTGGEGEVSPRVAGALEGQGWAPRPLDSAVHDDAHVNGRNGAPPRTESHRRT
jgi:hypothetical protein